MQASPGIVWRGRFDIDSSIGSSQVSFVSKIRQLRRMGTFGFLGLALCVFLWGLQYKLSLYAPQEAASHQIPIAKLLSQNEQSWTTERQQAVRTRNTAKVLYTAPAAAFLTLLMLFCIVDNGAGGQREARASRAARLRHSVFLDGVFVRPPPSLI